MADEITNASVAKDALDLVRALKAGEVDESQLSDKGQMLLALGRKDVRLADLTSEGKKLLGLPIPITDRVLDTLKETSPVARAYNAVGGVTGAFQGAKNLGAGLAKGWAAPPATSEEGPGSAEGAGRHLGGAARAASDVLGSALNTPSEQQASAQFVGQLMDAAGRKNAPKAIQWLSNAVQKYTGALEAVVTAPFSAGLEFLSKLPGYQAGMEDFWLPLVAQAGGRNTPGAQRGARASAASEAIHRAEAEAPWSRPGGLVEGAAPNVGPPAGGLRTGDVSRAEGRARAAGPSIREGFERPALPEGPPNFERVPPSGRTRSMLPPGQETRALPEGPPPASQRTVDADEYRRVIRGAGDRELPAGPPEPGRPRELAPHVNFERLTPADEPIAPLRGSETRELPPYINYERVPPPPPPASGMTVDAPEVRVLEGDDLRRAIRGKANAPPAVPEAFRREEIGNQPGVPPGQRELPPHVDWRRPPPGEPVAPDVAPPVAGEPFNLPPPPERAAPKFEASEAGPQGIIEGTPERAGVPDKAVKASVPQVDVSNDPLFNPERAAKADAIANLQRPPAQAEIGGPDVSMLPPVQPGFIRLYRGEGLPSGKKLPDWVREGKAANGSAAAEGRWFTADPGNADWYVKDAGKGRLMYVDVPEGIARASHLPNLAKDHPALKFSRDPESEFFLARDWADKKAPVEAGGLPPAQVGDAVNVAQGTGVVHKIAGDNAVVKLDKGGRLVKAKVADLVASNEPKVVAPPGAPSPLEALVAKRDAASARADARIRELENAWNEGGTASGRREPIPQDNIRSDAQWRAAQADIQRAEAAIRQAQKDARVIRARPGAFERKQEFAGGVPNLADPDDVYQLVRGKIKVTDALRGDLRDAPAWAKNKNGLPLERIAESIEEAYGIPRAQAMEQIIDTLRRYGSLKEAKKNAPKMSAPPGWSGMSQAEWDMSSPRERAFFEEEHARGGQGAARLGTLAGLGGATAAGLAGAPSVGLPDAAAHHEQSETIQRPDGKWINVYGRPTGKYPQPLPKQYPFEKDAYDTVEEAEAAARRRSDEEGKRHRKPLNAQDIVAGLGGLAAMGAMFGGLRRGKMPPEMQARINERLRGVSPDAASHRPPSFAPQYAREYTGLVPPGERPAVSPSGVTPPPGAPAAAGGGGRPPTGPPTPATEPATPSPYRGIPMEHLDGRTIWGGTKEISRYFAATMDGRLEAMAAPGKEVARLRNRVAEQTAEWTGLNVEPVMGQLSRLTKAEKANFWDVLETEGARPMNNKVQAAMDRWDVLFGTPTQEGIIPAGADQRNILVKVYDTSGDPSARAFQPRFGPNGHYAPHEFDPSYVREVLKPSSRARRAAIEYLVDHSGLDPETAAITIDNQFGALKTRIGNRIIDLSPERRVGGLENAREMNLDTYIRDPEVVVGIRGAKVARRFAEIDHYGPMDRVIGHVGGAPDPVSKQPMPPSGLIGDIHRASGSADAATAEALFHYYTGGQHPWQTSFGQVARAATNVETFMHLPLAFLNDLANAAILAVRTNTITMMRAFSKTALHPSEGRQQVRDMGLLSKQTLQDFYASLGAEGAFAEGHTPSSMLAQGGQWALRGSTSAWNASLRMQEMIMANAGGIWADRLNGMLSQQRTGRQTAWLGRELDRLHFSPAEIRNRMETGQFTPEDIRRIKWEIVDQTLYISGTGRQTEFMKNPLGRVAQQFKFWTINTGRMLKQNVWEEMKHGNMAPAARMAALFPIFGELYQDAKSAVRGTERPGDVGDRLMDDFFAAGGLALVTDFVQQLQQRGARGALQWASGPALSDLAEVSDHGYKLTARAMDRDYEGLRKEMHSTGRFLTKQVPFFGPWFSTQMRDDPKAQERARRTWTERLGLDPWTNAMRDAERVERMGRAVQKHAHELAAQGKIDDAQAALETFNIQHGTHFGLNPAAIMRRRELGIIQADPRGEAALRMKRLSPGVQGILQQGVAAGKYTPPPGGR